MPAADEAGDGASPGSDMPEPVAPADAPAALPFDPSSSSLKWFHPGDAVFQGLDAGRFTKIRKIADAIAGKVYLYRMHVESVRADEVVVVKKMPNRNVESARQGPSSDKVAFYRRVGTTEDPLNEIGVLLYLNSQPDMCRYLLRSLTLVRDAQDTMLVTEHCEDELFNVVSAQSRGFPEERTKAFMWQLLRAVHYLHSHNIGHCDISLENVLVKHGEARLMDFGQAVQLHQNGSPQNIYRYFRPRGKNYYRSPESYIPQTSPWQAPCPPNYFAESIVVVQHQGFLTEVAFRAGFVVGQMCQCQCCGYAISPVDIFACGVTMFILHSQQPPWRIAMATDQLFAFICVNGVAPLWAAWQKPSLSAEGMELLGLMIRPYPATRLLIHQCLDHPWFNDIRTAAGGGGPSGGDNGDSMSPGDAPAGDAMSRA